MMIYFTSPQLFIHPYGKDFTRFCVVLGLRCLKCSALLLGSLCFYLYISRKSIVYCFGLPCTSFWSVSTDCYVNFLFRFDSDFLQNTTWSAYLLNSWRVLNTALLDLFYLHDCWISLWTYWILLRWWQLILVIAKKFHLYWCVVHLWTRMRGVHKTGLLSQNILALYQLLFIVPIRIALFLNCKS